MSNFSHRAQRGGTIANGCLAFVFRVALLILFAPIALRYAMRGAWFECSLTIACALALGAAMAARD